MLSLHQKKRASLGPVHSCVRAVRVRAFESVPIEEEDRPLGALRVDDRFVTKDLAIPCLPQGQPLELGCQ